ncbi:phosphoribosylanthranilate isomerase [Tropicibacter naphthalenivorans]|uniref:N-(5'-phosphoribosyl)anthranilate isomerase n=1 Tax=Tropicibacter naphthalenivorans TaxID=441103 RepID=A0A0P1GFX0_9RHOB|nr:phosphoribosylanthranilate isomerase [Tropicibacter naphthalenivorans]CUH75140.1 N-(5'-phosphoribosyl)anthranilate isomerase [Tropicibacter naphthalenivorans]SMC46037.1 phosphoribosylanthranilate isomerase [Tropicibacter naphthalenivorans]
MQDVRVKICGLTRAADVEAVAEAGASYAGFVFFPKSPRNVSVAQARELAVLAPVGLAKVGLVVNPTDALLDEILAEVPLDIIQLHGAESPERVAEVRARYGLPVMKAVGVAEEADLAKVASYQGVADQILIDAKPPKEADLPGGNGLAFDWRLVAGRRFGKPWMLAGGLTPENVGTAVAMTGVRQVDVSSGVESAPGVKDAGTIRAFVEAARGAKVPPRL